MFCYFATYLDICFSFFLKCISFFLILKYTNNMTKKELQKLRRKIGPGYLKLLHQKTGRAKSTICQVMKGDWHNQEILDAAFEILSELNDKRELQKQLLES